MLEHACLRVSTVPTFLIVTAERRPTHAHSSGQRRRAGARGLAAHVGRGKRSNAHAPRSLSRGPSPVTAADITRRQRFGLLHERDMKSMA